MKLRSLPCLLILLLNLLPALRAGAVSVQAYYQQYTPRDIEAFVKHFPFVDYLEEVAFTDFETLQEDREYLWRKYGDGDLFLYHLGEKFITYYPVTSDQVQEKLAIGEKFLASKPGIQARVDEVYQIIGYFIMGKVARRIERDIQEGHFDPALPENQAILDRLHRHKVAVAIGKSTAQKLFERIKQGDWAYIGNRMRLKVQEHFYPLQQSFKGVLLIPLIAFALFWGVIFLVRRKWKTRLLSVGMITLVMVFPWVLQAIQHQAPSEFGTIRPPSYQLSGYRFLYGQEKDPAVGIFTLENADEHFVGHAIFIHRPAVDAHYFAHGRTAGRFQQFRRNRREVIATSGGFTNGQGLPEGLTVENGQIVNAVIMHDRHGLVMVRKGGGINVINLQKDGHILPRTGKSIQSPLNSLVAYADLLHWCKREKATLFQTQLLAYGDELLIDKNRAHPEPRERRILALVSEKGQVHHVIFDIQQAHPLADIAEELFAMLKHRNKKVEAMLNLDVGSYNILQVYDEQGQTLPAPRGPVDLQKAANLIVYTH